MSVRQRFAHSNARFVFAKPKLVAEKYCFYGIKLKNVLVYSPL